MNDEEAIPLNRLVVNLWETRDLGCISPSPHMSSNIFSIALVMLEVATLKRSRNRHLSWSSLKMAELLIPRTMM